MRTLLLALLAPAAAHAVPTALTHSGRLLDADGAPRSGSEAITFALHDVAVGGDPVWVQTTTVALSDGFYTVLLNGVDSADLVGDRWFAVTVDGVEVSPRQPLTAVPYAVQAGGLSLGDVDRVCDATTTALHGTLRFRDDVFEGCTSDGWTPVGREPFLATGGTVADLGGYRIHTFTSGGTFTAVGGSGSVEVLVVGGGGGGGGRSGGGGGAGGVVYDPSFSVASGQALTVSVGLGGSGGGGTGGVGTDGGASAFGALTAAGGGGGGSDNSSQHGRNGGSGGGAQYNGNPGSGIAGQGNGGGGGVGSTPYNSGGGGGAGEVGEAALSTRIGDGGDGLSYSISGAAVWYGGGGGGGAHNPCPGDRGEAGQGGGGRGGVCGGKNAGENGVNGTGGGGGGGSTDSSNGGNGGRGGDGIVIIRYPN